MLIKYFEEVLFDYYEIMTLNNAFSLIFDNESNESYEEFNYEFSNDKSESEDCVLMIKA